MEITRNLEITASEFFDCLFQNTVDEIAKESKKEISTDSIKKGFKFVHQGKDAYSRITFEVVDYQKDEYYKAKRTSFGGSVTVSYKVVPNDKGITVTLQQNVIQSGKPVEYKGIFGKFSEMLYLGRMSDNLYDIQKKVINTKEGYVEPKLMQPLFKPKKK
ncbi:MAG: DUF3284 domain-containing protein [Erysipelotrichales bacterium]|nr:DUF3284 domain-containing protein [Erysipelotrichales bacterium]